MVSDDVVYGFNTKKLRRRCKMKDFFIRRPVVLFLTVCVFCDTIVKVTSIVKTGKASSGVSINVINNKYDKENRELVK